MGITLFGWTIILRIFKRKHYRPENGLRGGWVKEGAPKIAFDGKWFYMCDPDGYVLPGCIDCTITDSVHEPTKINATYFVGGMTEYRERPANIVSESREKIVIP